MRPLAIALLLLLQETPADTIKKLEESLGGAKSLTIKAFVKITGKQENTVTTAEFTATLKSKGEGLALFSLEGSVNGKPRPTTSVVSDGKRAKYQSGNQTEGQSGISDHKAALGVLSRKLIVRAGIFGAADVMIRAASSPEPLDIDKMYTFSEVAAAADEKLGGRDCKVFTLGVSTPGLEKPVRCKIWIDAEKKTLLQRETTVSSAKTSGTITETYSDVTLDVELPDDLFKIDK